MSLFRQLWLAVIASAVIAFAGSFIVSTLTARHYLERQLAIKNNDNAATLALAMSQLDKDPVTIELQIAAVSDSGQYAAVRLIDGRRDFALHVVRMIPNCRFGISGIGCW